MDIYNDYENFIKNHPWQQINVEGNLINYRHFGKGEKTILLLLGGSMFSADAYFLMIEGLKDDYQLIMIDYPKDKQTILSLIQTVSEVTLKLNIPKVYVFGMNYGGGIAQAYAKHYKNQVDGLILYNTLTKSEQMTKHAYQVIENVIEALNELKALREMMPLESIKSALLDQIKTVITDSNHLMLYEKLISQYQDDDEQLQMLLIKDLLTTFTFRIEDFQYLKNRMLLFYAHDDDPLGGTELIETLAELCETAQLAFIETDRFNLIVNPNQMIENIKAFIK